ncbi:hypothetical protein Pyn_27467 [Prunus yedoensis var. nudiflora]|uniref:Uncharacterized protein n=1 Tax=Prunus yedoensis var. nudiflora TaxID=2094558 RepID=A0A314Y5D2_PRUYE|nr:hypothetical protein Pyn_27467 [Prunus yedoensis var. nudiflora]
MGAFSFQQLDEWAWAAVKSKWLESPLVSEFENQTPSVLRKGCKALGNTLVTFTNENNGCSQINFWLCMRSLWHGSKIDISLAPKRRLSVLGGKRGIKVGDGEFAKRFG